MEVFIFDPKDFRARKGDILKYFDKKGVTSDSVAEYCTLAMVPITVVYAFISEEYPEHEELCRVKIREINEFFGIK